MKQNIILSKVIDYLKNNLENFSYSKRDKIFTCIYCKEQSCQIIPKSGYKVQCLSCNSTYNLLDIVRALEEDKVNWKDDKIIDYLETIYEIEFEEELDISNNQLDKILSYYSSQSFDLLPIVKNSKIPAEQKWTEKNHINIEEQRHWLNNDMNIGVKTGNISNITVIDIDTEEIPEEVKKFMGNPLIQKSNKGWHLFYKYDSELGTTRIDELKIDILNDGRQVVIFPSIVDGIQRQFVTDLKDISKIPEELKTFLLSKMTVSNRKTYSEKLTEDIANQNFNLGILEEGQRNASLMRLGGIFRQEFSLHQTENIIRVLNNTCCNPRLPDREIRAMMGSLDRYVKFDEQELASKILSYLKVAKEVHKGEIEGYAFGGRTTGEDKKKLESSLSYLIKEEYIIKKSRNTYQLIEKMDWKDTLLDIGIPVNFKVPYFHKFVNFNIGDLIILGSKNKYGKTTLSQNFLKRLVTQGIKPYYIYNESGARFSETAIQLGMKDGDYYRAFCTNPESIILEDNAVTIFDWVKPNEFNRTDELFNSFVEKLEKTKGFMICFVQLKEDNEFFAKNMIGQFPALLGKYLYENDTDNINTLFEICDVRDSKIKQKRFTIPCRYNWDTREVQMVEEIKEEK